MIRALRWRLGPTLVLFAAAVGAVAAASMGPVWLRGCDASVLRSELGAASVQRLGLTVAPPPPARTTLSRLRTAVTNELGPTGGRWYGPPVYTALTGAALSRPGQTFHAQLLARTDLRHHLDLLSGRWPSAAGDVAISDRTAALTRLPVGRRVVVTLGATRASLLVTGIYHPPASTAGYWWGGSEYFAFGGQDATGVQLLDSFVTTFATALHVPPQAVPTLFAQVPVLAGHLTPADVPSFRRDLAAARRALGTRDGLTVSTGIGSALGQVSHQQHLDGVVIAVADIEVVAIGLWVLYLLVVRAGESRTAEVRLARLRGFTRRATAAVVLAEPVVVVLTALPCGVALGWLTARIAGTGRFSPGSHYGLDPLALAAAGAAALAALVAVVGGSARFLRPPQPAGASPAASPPGRRWYRGHVALDTAAVVLAVAATVELHAAGVGAGGTDPLAAAAPLLLAVGIAVTGTRVAGVAARVLAGRNADSRRVATFLASRRITRRPVLFRQTIVLAVAVGLTLFAVADWSAAARQRRVQARFSLGASEVVHVAVPGNVDLMAAVERADPGGHAMAAVIVRTPSSTLAAVDATRMAAVVSWPRGLASRPASQVARLLRPPTAGPIILTGSAVRLSVDLTRAISLPVDLDLLVFDRADRASAVVPIGRLAAGNHSYQGSLQGRCHKGCRLLGVSPVPVVPNGDYFAADPSTGRTALFTPDGRERHLGSLVVVLHTLQVARAGRRFLPVAAGFGTVGSWRSGVAGVAVGRGASPGTLAVRFDPAALGRDAAGVETGAGPLVTPADHPVPLPAVVTAGLAARNNVGGLVTTVPVQGLDGRTVDVRPALEVPTLPAVGANAAMIDLGNLRLVQAAATLPAASAQVWVGAGAPADLVSRLRHGGLRALGVQRAAAVAGLLGREGLGLADDFFVLAAFAMTLLASLSFLYTLVAPARQRAAELMGLQSAGIDRRTLRRALLGESMAPVVIGLLLGMIAGPLAAALTLPSLPGFAATLAGPPPQRQLPVAALALAATITLVALLAAATVAAGWIVRRATPAALRMDPE